MQKSKQQFFHKIPGMFSTDGYTICLNVPDKSFLKKTLIIDSKEFGLTVGLAKLHPTDRYVRSTGRDVSQANMKSGLFKLSSVKFLDDCEIYHFISHCSEVGHIYLKIKNDKVHFIKGII